MSKNYLTKSIAIDDIVVEPVFQCRESIDSKVVDEYAALVDEGLEFPPVEVVNVDGKMYLTDGFCRRAAYKKANKKKIKANVYEGDRDFAIERACSANETHGIKRNANDKRKAVRLAMETFPDKTAREIAKICSVSHTFVNAQQKKDAVQQDAPETAAMPAKVETFPPPKSPEPTWEDVDSEPDEEVETEEVSAESEPAIVPNKPIANKPKAKAPSKAGVTTRDDLSCKICAHKSHVETDAGWLCEDCGGLHVEGDEYEDVDDESPAPGKRSKELEAVHTALGVLIRKASKINVLTSLKDEFDSLSKKINSLG